MAVSQQLRQLCAAPPAAPQLWSAACFPVYSAGNSRRTLVFIGKRRNKMN
jgi:hypothetical protein